MGLNGKAVLPMVLGLGLRHDGDDDDAHPGNAEGAAHRRAAAGPRHSVLGAAGDDPRASSAASRSLALVTLFGVVLLQMFLVGFLAARACPASDRSSSWNCRRSGYRSCGNIVRKTLLRVRWYLGEAVPLFLVGTALLFVLSRLGLLAHLTAAAEPVVAGLLGLPRDGGRGLRHGLPAPRLRRRGPVPDGAGRASSTGVQAVVALTVMTLFVPCVANFLMMVKEQGMKAALGDPRAS